MSARLWNGVHMAAVPNGFESAVEVGPEGGEIGTGALTAPMTDWSAIFEQFNLDPNVFEIIDDTVRMSSWQTSKRTDDGDRDVVTLYAYRARFRRLTQSSVSKRTIDAWKTALRRSGARQSTVPGVATGDVSYVVCIADPQLGKKGTDEALANWKRGVLQHVDRICRFENITSIVVAFMGDEHEGVANNYANQPHTVELNLSAQLELDYEMRVWTIQQFAALGVPVDVVSVISNHGEFTRNGSKDVVTTKADNSSTMISRMVKMLFDQVAGYEHIRWHIAEANPEVIIRASGIKLYFSHGHIAKGPGATPMQRVKTSLERQLLGKEQLLNDVTLFFVAHYHHYYLCEFGTRTLFGCPALEAEKSSEYMLDQYGVWNRPGMLGVVVGKACGPRGYGEHIVF